MEGVNGALGCLVPPVAHVTNVVCLGAVVHLFGGYGVWQAGLRRLGFGSELMGARCAARCYQWIILEVESPRGIPSCGLSGCPRTRTLFQIIQSHRNLPLQESRCLRPLNPHPPHLSSWP